MSMISKYIEMNIEKKLISTPLVKAKLKKWSLEDRAKQAFTFAKQKEKEK